jgi:phospholipid/cholesterol/gamma-HCH transport system permease protein
MSGFGAAVALLLQPNVEAVGFDISDLGDWDTSLLVFLSTLRSASQRRQVRFDQTGLPPAARQLLAQLSDEPSTHRGARRIGMIERVGVRTIGRWRNAAAVIRLVGEAILRCCFGW